MVILLEGPCIVKGKIIHIEKRDQLTQEDIDKERSNYYAILLNDEKKLCYVDPNNEDFILLDQISNFDTYLVNNVMNPYFNRFFKIKKIIIKIPSLVLELTEECNIAYYHSMPYDSENTERYLRYQAMELIPYMSKDQLMKHLQQFSIHKEKGITWMIGKCLCLVEKYLCERKVIKYKYVDCDF